MVQPTALAGADYDDVPYPSHAFAQSHPDTMAVLARIFGLPFCPPDRARILEIGCSTGGNLLPLAALWPDAACVGIDLSERQIGWARRLAAQAGLDRVRFEARDVAGDLSDLGRFDYIVAHGVLSWVPRAVQEAILRVCATHLTDRGLAYISYNVHPGWHYHGATRQILGWAGRDEPDPLARIGKGRALVGMLANAVPEDHGPWHHVLQRARETVELHSDAYLVHEFLEAHNDPVLFTELVARARAHGLDWVTESPLSALLDLELSPVVRDQLQAWSADLVELEQYFDFVRNRTFRQSIFTHAGRPVRRDLRTFDPAGLFLSCRATVTPRDGGGAQVARSDTAVQVDHPGLARALLGAAAAWPTSPAIDALCADLDADERIRVGLGLLQLASMHLVTLHATPVLCAIEAGDHPHVWPLSRALAATQHRLPTPRLENVDLTPQDLRLLRRCDGRTTRAALLASIDRDHARHRDATGAPHPEPPLDADALDAKLEDWARWGMLVAP